jgi:lysyl-tRNA synthetase class 2
VNMWSESGNGLSPAQLSEMRAMLELRGEVYRAVREYFFAQEFLEIESPVRIRTPAQELYIDAVQADGAWLRTSPELHLKRLVAAGYEKIYHMGPCFRKNEHGRRHNPEYTMLEWYRADADYIDVMADIKSLIAHVSQAVLGHTDIEFSGHKIALLPRWEVLSVAEAFMTYAGWNPVLNWDPDRFDMDLVNKVEPSLPVDCPVILKDYPAEAGALARRKPDSEDVCERWELYVGGLELANAYSELTDAEEQRRRFEECGQARTALGRVAYELDEPFLQALESGLPACAGVALGIDRLIMILADCQNIGDLLPFREVSR